jgi:aspartate/methionine/tyrosine aminotransferase
MRSTYISFVYIFSFFISASLNLNAQEQEKYPPIFFQPNTTQIFSELYHSHELMPLKKRVSFERALYLDQSVPPGPFPLQPSNIAVFDKANEILTKFHQKIGDLELYIDFNKPPPFFYTTAGSKQLIVALVYAIAMTEPNKKFLFVEKAPFYSGHPNAVTEIFHYPNARFVAFHNPKDIKLEPGEEIVEFITSPNNPDGKFRQPETEAKIIIADLVFASSAFGSDGTGYLEKNIQWIKDARSKGKLVFSFNSASKQFGFTGSRCGYIWYPLYNEYASLIFPKFYGFISSSTVAAGTIGLEEFLNLILTFNDLMDLGKSLRFEANKSLINRHKLLSKEFLNRYPDSEIISIPGSPTFFSKVKDKRIPKMQAWQLLRDDFNVFVNNGESMGETSEYIRLNLSGISKDFIDFLNRLAGSNRYDLSSLESAQSL